MKQASFTLTDAGTISTRPLVKLRFTLLAVFGLVGLAPLSAATLVFQRVTDNSSVDLSPDLTVEVTDLGGGQALFSIDRGTEYEAFVRNVYFEDLEGNLGTITFSPDFSTPGVAMGGPSQPPHPPGLSPFVVDSSFVANPLGPKNGIDLGESGAFVAAYNGTYQDLLAALEAGTVRMAVHAQGIVEPNSDACFSHPDAKGGGGGDDYHAGEIRSACPKGGESDTYVTLPIPEPSSLVLLCLASLGLLRRVRR